MCWIRPGGGLLVCVRGLLCRGGRLAFALQRARLCPQLLAQVTRLRLRLAHQQRRLLLLRQRLRRSI